MRNLIPDRGPVTSSLDATVKELKGVLRQGVREPDTFKRFIAELSGRAERQRKVFLGIAAMSEGQVLNLETAWRSGSEFFGRATRRGIGRSPMCPGVHVVRRRSDSAAGGILVGPHDPEGFWTSKQKLKNFGNYRQTTQKCPEKTSRMAKIYVQFSNCGSIKLTDYLISCPKIKLVSTFV
jgi:hypothetical protein